MHHKTLLATAAAVLLAGTSMFAVAQDAAQAPQKPAMSQQHASKDGAKGHEEGHGRFGQGHGGHGMGRGGMHRSPVIGDLRSLERLYMIEGKAKELPALYNDVLAKTKNPMVRDYVYHRLARIQAMPTNVDQSIATMRKSLDENLARDADMRAKMEQMRAQWQQKHADGATKQ
jgi:hypothetical protein